jgi:hypothetical protein
MLGPILFHDKRKRPPARSPGDPHLFLAVSMHVERYIGPIRSVLHDLEPDEVHLDILWVPPGRDHDFHTFVTCGMAERAMIAPDGWTGPRHAELLLRLPSSWPLRPTGRADPARHWPILELEAIAMMPHLYDTWLWAWHTVTNCDPPQPLPGAERFAGSIVVPVEWADPDFDKLTMAPDREIQFLSVIPLYPEELDMARRFGPSDLADELARAGVTDLLDVARPCVTTTGGGTDD